MPTKIKPARKGLFHWLWRRIKLATAFALSALLSYYSVGGLRPDSAPTQIAQSP